MAKKLMATLSDSTLFLREWLTNPQRTGAVAPSSRNLALAMARWLPADPQSYVLELGPGTGAVTEAMLRHGLREKRLIAIEKNPKLAELLRKRFPHARILTGDAQDLESLLQNDLHPIGKVGAVISSLPLLNFSPEDADSLASKIGNVLDANGKWVQYSYRLGNRQLPGTSQFQLRASKIVWLNVPPARVSVFQK